MGETDKTPEKLIGFGCMRVGGGERGASVVGAALAAGARLLDTARAYYEAGGKPGDNERLVAGAIASSASGGEVTVATKGGMTRVGARWIPDGKAKSIRADCEASLFALGSPALDLFLLHAPDPRVSWATSVRALEGLRVEGLARSIGLCNVNRAQLDEALALADISAVQVALSPLDDRAIRGGVVERCREASITVIAHSPLGGPRERKKLRWLKALAEIAERFSMSVEDLSIAWLCHLVAPLVPIPGATSPETAALAVAAQKQALAPEILADLDRALPAGRVLSTTRSKRRGVGDGDVVIIMGCPGAGKTSAAAELVRNGYQRLNRDQRGGALADLIKPLEHALSRGQRRVVLDNTYASRASRNEVIETAWRHGAPVRCLYLETSIEEAQRNVAGRMIDANEGELPSPEVIAAMNKKKVAGFYGPGVLFNYRRSLEEPETEEGFEAIERRPFVRRPAGDDSVSGLIVEIDGVLRASRRGRPRPLDPDDVEVVAGRGEVLRRYDEDGWTLVGISWQPEIGSGEAEEALVRSCFDRTCQLLGVELDVVFCPHVAGPPKCWCRRPLPGLGELVIRRHNLDPSRSIYVGKNATDALWAARLGFQAREVSDFF